jgi:hypothetical protein
MCTYATLLERSKLMVVKYIINTIYDEPLTILLSKPETLSAERKCSMKQEKKGKRREEREKVVCWLN